MILTRNVWRPQIGNQEPTIKTRVKLGASHIGLSSWLITQLVTRVTRRVPQVKHRRFHWCFNRVLSIFFCYEKKVLSSDGHQFPPYQQNVHLSSCLNTNRPRHVILEIQVLPWDRYNNAAGPNLSMGSQSSPLNNWIFKGNHKNEWQHKYENCRFNECS